MLREYLKSLADKFRTYLGGEPTDLINAQDFPSAIDDVYEAGKQAGGGSGDSVMWDMVTANGTRKNYTYSFAYWSFVDSYGNITFNLPINLKPTIVSSMFAYITNKIDLADHLEKIGRTIDFSDCTVAQQCFYTSQFTRLWKCDWSKCPNLNATYRNCSDLVTIDEIVFNENINYNFTNTFAGCTSLQNVTATGSLATSGLDLSECPLTRTSKLSFLNILSQTSTTKTITFGAGETLTNEDVAIGTQKGWSVTV